MNPKLEAVHPESIGLHLGGNGVLELWWVVSIVDVGDDGILVKTNLILNILEDQSDVMSWDFSF